VPPELDELNEDVVVAGCERLGFALEHHSNDSWSIDFGNEALVDHLPGVPGGASFLGAFAREIAVADDALDFFAAGHPLVEGLLAHLDESPLGRTCILRLAFGAERGLGLLALYRQGHGFEAVVLDATGRARPEWAAALLRRPLRTRRVGPDDVPQPEFGEQVRRLGELLDPERRPVAMAALVVGA
jgi:ATP-dependent helicase HepA